MNTHLGYARRFAHLMDSQFKIFGVSIGLDSVIGLIPGAGDVATMFLSGYLVWIGYQMHLPVTKLLQMVGNILVDTLIGAIPLIGDLGDIFFKANLKNLAILEEFDHNIVEGEVVEA